MGRTKVYCILSLIIFMGLCCVGFVYAQLRLRVRPEAWSRPVIGSDLENFCRVDDGVYRSEQPGKEDFLALYAFGVREVLNLREYHTDNGEAEGLPFTLHHIRIRTGALSQEELMSALAIIKNRQGPILVHCWHGSDRTGAVVAAYRIAFQGWTKEDAIDEMVNGGYGHHGFIYANLIKVIEAFDAEGARVRLGL